MSTRRRPGFEPGSLSSTFVGTPSFISLRTMGVASANCNTAAPGRRSKYITETEDLMLGKNLEVKPGGHTLPPNPSKRDLVFFVVDSMFRKAAADDREIHLQSRKGWRLIEGGRRMAAVPSGAEEFILTIPPSEIPA